MHVITAIIGAGVLSLPAAMVPLGYAGGSICFLLFGLITLYTAHLLSATYCINGLRQRTYTALVDTVFGRKGEIAVAWIQLVNLILTAWPYQILGAKTMAALAKEAVPSAGCPSNRSPAPPPERSARSQEGSGIKQRWNGRLEFSGPREQPLARGAASRSGWSRALFDLSQLLKPSKIEKPAKTPLFAPMRRSCDSFELQ